MNGANRRAESLVGAGRFERPTPYAQDAGTFLAPEEGTNFESFSWLETVYTPESRL